MCLHTLHATDLIADLSGYYPAGAAYAPNAPERLLETRQGQPTGQKGWTGAAKPAAGQTIELQVTGTGTANLPADTKAVFLNVTTVNTDSPGWLVAYPCGEPRPAAASNVNQLPGLVRSNLVAAKVGAGGKVCLYTYSATDIVVDLLGSAPAASTFVPTAPERVLETRKSEGQINYSAARPVAGQTVEVKVIGFGTTKVPADAGTVLLNVTAVDPDSAGTVTVFPCGTPRAAGLEHQPHRDHVGQPRVGQGRRRRPGVHLHHRRHGPDRRHPGLLPGHRAGLIQPPCASAPAGRSVVPPAPSARHRPPPRTHHLST